MTRLVRPALATAVLAGLVVAIPYADLHDGFARTRSVDALGALLEPHLIIELPEPARAGEGPHPVVIMLPGCTGLHQADGRRKPVTFAYGDIARSEGLAVIHADSFRPRGLDYDGALFWTCSGYRLRGSARAGDVVALLELARADPRFDRSRIAVAGWSHGGWAIMEALSYDYQEAWPPTLKPAELDAFAGLAGAFLVYPYCGWPSRTPDHGWPNPVPAMFVLAEGDVVTQPGDCVGIADGINASGGDVSVEMLEGAVHSFDEADTGPGDAPDYVYDPEYEAQAHALFRQFVRAVRDGEDPLALSRDR